MYCPSLPHLPPSIHVLLELRANHQWRLGAGFLSSMNINQISNSTLVQNPCILRPGSQCDARACVMLRCLHVDARRSTRIDSDSILAFLCVALLWKNRENLRFASSTLVAVAVASLPGHWNDQGAWGDLMSVHMSYMWKQVSTDPSPPGPTILGYMSVHVHVHIVHVHASWSVFTCTYVH